MLASMLANSNRSFALPELQFLPAMLQLGNAQQRDPDAVATILLNSSYFLDLRICAGRAELDDLIKDGEPVAVVERILTRYIEMYMRKHPHIWIEHTPQNYRSFHLLKHFYPAAKFVHIVRDGRAAFNSVKRLPWGPNDVVNGAEWWARAVTECLSITAMNPDRVMTVRYEDLVTETAGALAAICEFVDLPYAEEMREGRGLIKPRWTLQLHRLVGQPPDPTVAYKWREELSPSEIAYFSHENHELLHRLGYAESVAPERPFGVPREAITRMFGKVMQVYRRKRNRRRFMRQFEAERRRLMAT